MLDLSIWCIGLFHSCPHSVGESVWSTIWPNDYCFFKREQPKNLGLSSQILGVFCSCLKLNCITNNRKRVFEAHLWSVYFNLQWEVISSSSKDVIFLQKQRSFQLNSSSVSFPWPCQERPFLWISSVSGCPGIRLWNWEIGASGSKTEHEQTILGETNPPSISELSELLQVLRLLMVNKSTGRRLYKETLLMELPKIVTIEHCSF